MSLQPSHVRGLYSEVHVHSVDACSFTIMYGYESGDELKLRDAIIDIAKLSHSPNGTTINASFGGSYLDAGKTWGTFQYTIGPTITPSGRIITNRAQPSDIIQFVNTLSKQGGLGTSDDLVRNLARDIQYAQKHVGHVRP